MAQPYVGEIRMFAGNFEPIGWKFCHGQLLSISENETLFLLIGTTYGGDGESTFALPDMRGRLPLHQGDGFVLAETGGAEYVTLTVSQIPAHSHAVIATNEIANSSLPGNNLIATSSSISTFHDDTVISGNMHYQSVGYIGGSQPHDNMMPGLCLNFIISLFGIFPTPT